MNEKTTLEQLEYWIEQYYRINGTPTLDDIKGQINLLKDYEREQLRKHAVMCWVSVKDALPTKDGQYCTYLQTSKYDSIGFTQFLDGQFMSSFVTHWMEVVKPCT